MKKHIIFFSLLVSIFIMSNPITADAQQPGEEYAIFNWQNNGDFNAFLNCDVDSITYSKVGLDGKTYSSVVVQEVWTPDSLYRIPIAAIDSVTFRAPEPVMKESVFHITGNHFPYVTEVTESSVTFIASIPSSMLPNKEQIVISDSVYVEPFPHGFAGKVTNIIRTGDIVRVECEDVSLEDIYESMICVGKVVTYDDSGSPSRVPKRMGGEDAISVPFRSFSIEFEKESNKISLNVQPELTFDYAIRILEGHNNHFKFIVKSGLDCDFNYNWNKSFISLDTVYFPLKPIKIPTNVPGLHAEINVGGFVDFSGSATIDLTHRFHLESQMGYDSWEKNNGRDGLIFKFFKENTLRGSAKIETTLSAGLALKVGVCLVSETIDEANLTLKVGPRVSGNIEFNTNMTQAPSWENFGNVYVTLEPITAKLSGGVKVFTHEKNWDLWELPIGDWFPVLGPRRAYLFPELSKPYLRNPVFAIPLGLSMTALTSNISRDLILPIRPGIELYKDGFLVDRIFSEKTYTYKSEWKTKNLQMELLDNYPVGTYTAKPVFKIFDKFTISVDSVSTITIPNPLSGVPSFVTLTKGESKNISFTGGWGEYTLLNKDKTICSSTFTSSSITIQGLKIGTDTLHMIDIRPMKDYTIVVNVVGDSVIDISPSSYDFGTIVKGKVSNPQTFTVSSNLSGTPLLSPSGDINMFTVTNTLSTNGKFSVTYKPTEVGTHTMTITVSGGGVTKTMTVTGTCIQPVITVTPPSLTFVGSQTKTLTVTGEDLTGPMTLTLIETGAHGYFSISPTTLPAEGGKVTVTCSAVEAGSFSGQIKISGGDAETKTVSLSGSVAANITVAPTSYNFGKIVKNKISNPQTFAVSSNLSGTPLLSPSGDINMFTVTNTLSTNGKFSVTYKPTEVGTHTMTITVSGGGVTKTVTVTGTCIQPVITVTPPSLTFVGSQTKTLTVTGEDLTGPMTLTLIETGAHGYFSISPTTLPAEGGKVTVTCSAVEAGSFSGQIKISGGDAETKTVSLSGSVAANINVDPTYYDFGTFVKGQISSAKTFAVSSNLSGTPLLSPSGDINMFTVTNTLSTNGKFSVTYKPTEVGTHTMTITVSGGGVTKTVTVTGTCIQPVITVTPPSLTFVGSQTKTLTVTGEDLTGPMTLTLIETGAHGYFSISPTTLPAEGGKVTVTCSAVEAGSFSGQIKISGGDAETKTVSLSGSVAANITVAPTSYNFGKIVKNKISNPQTFAVSSNLSGTPLLSPSGDINMFTVTNTLSTNGKFSVTYKPTEVGTHTMTITVSGGGVTKTVTVIGTCIQPVITVTPPSLTFVGSQTKTLTVTGEDLTGPMTLTLIETGAHGYFSISPTTLPAEGGKVTVTCSAVEAGSFSGQIKISGGDAETKTVSLSGSVAANINVDPTYYDFGTFVKGQISSAKTFAVSSNLSGTPQLSPSGDVNMFTVTNTLSTNGKFSVKYKPSEVGTHTMYITVNGGGTSKTVTVKGKCTNPVITANSISFSPQNYSTLQTLTIKCTDANSPLTLSVSGDTNLFIGLPSNGTTISQSNAINGKSYSISCKPSIINKDSASVKIVISGGGADAKTVYVSYHKGQITASLVPTVDGFD